jgi:succinyl-CoA synthetase beta subunit
MRLHEFQAKTLLAGHGINVPEGRVALTSEDASAIARELGGEGFAVKAQIRSGERGKAGAVRIVRTPASSWAAPSSRPRPDRTAPPRTAFSSSAP